jgi:4-hydroxyphenylpyruvate dioxygenase
MNSSRLMSHYGYGNPLGTDGSEFIEFTSPAPEALAAQFQSMGFAAPSS